MIFAPIMDSHKFSQPPLKPVWPVISTFRPCQNSGLGARELLGAAVAFGICDRRPIKFKATRKGF